MVGIGRIFFLLASVLVIACANLFGQVIHADSLIRRVALYNASNPNGVLYLATDKDIYLPTETIWFAAYVIEPVWKADVALQPSILSVALMRDDTTNVSVRKNYQVSNWTASGSLTLPKDIEPGRYSILAATNIVDSKEKPIHSFVRSIIIRSATVSSVNVDFEVSEKAGTDSLFVRAKTVFPMGISASDRREAKLFYNFDNRPPKTAKFGADGIAIIPLRRTEIEQYGAILTTNSKIGNASTKFNVRLPTMQRNEINVGFYPEGGDLVSGLVSKVAWQVVTKEGITQAAKAFLLENGDVIDTISIDNKGAGVFMLRPKSDARYEAKFLTDNIHVKDKVFALPAIQQSGFVLHVENAVSEDTLMVEVFASKESSVSIAITSEYTRESVITPQIMVTDKGKKLSIPLVDIKKGLNTLTLLDGQGRPVAERLFFAHFGQASNASIITDKDSYKIRDKVSLQISIVDSEKKPTSGLFTVSCVQQLRLDTTLKQDLAAYYYLNPIADEQEHNVKLMSSSSMIANKDYLERILMVSGWRRYLWRDIQQSNDSLAHLIEKTLNAQFKFADGSQIGESLPVNIRNDDATITIATDKNGLITPKISEVTVLEGKNLEIKLMTKTGAIIYSTLKVDNPMEKIIAGLSSITRYSPVKNIQVQRTTDLKLKTSFTEINLLEEVVIGRRILLNAKSYGPNSCGDFVCVSGNLNCPGHSAFDPLSYAPIKGKSYAYVSPKGFVEGRVFYKGCVWELDELTVYTAKQFYGMDISKLANLNEKEYLSTVFWKDFSIMPDTGVASIDFLLGDLTGIFKIRVEGIDSNGEFYYQEKDIRVVN